MANFSIYRNSKSLLERAAYWAATASWLEPHDFEQAQADANALLELSRKQDAVAGRGDK